MINKYILASSCLVWIFLSSCTVSPAPIEYNYDQCSACKMTISDERFGCEYVTKKGRVYKFDAIECMVRDYKKLDSDELKYVLVTHFYNPNLLVDAFESEYLISKNRPSPMGEYLSAYESKEEFQKDFSSLGGAIYSWDELLTHDLLK